jgi:hypothetical protein
MLKQAIGAALDGWNVFVIGHNSRSTQILANKTLEILKRDNNLSGDIESNQLFIHKRDVGCIEFKSAADKDVVCLETYPYCVRGSSYQCFVDHYVREEAGWRPSHQKRGEPSHPWNLKLEEQFTGDKEEPTWSIEGCKRLWQSLFPGSPFGVVPNYTEIVKGVADTMVKKPYMSSADGDMRDKFGGGKLP